MIERYYLPNLSCAHSGAKLLVFGMLFLLSACKKPKEDVPPNPEIPVSAQTVLAEIGKALDGVPESDAFSTLFKALELTDDDVEEGLTVLVPIDGAFDKIIIPLALKSEVRQGALPTDVAYLPESWNIKDYLIKGIRNGTALKAGEILTALSGRQIKVSESNGQTLVEGVPILNKQANLGDHHNVVTIGKIFDVKYYLVNPKVVGGHYFSLLLRADSTVWGLGDNAYGELGLGFYYPTGYTIPQFIAEDVIDIAAGDYHSLLLKSDHSLWGMGDNYFGVLGLGHHGRDGIAVPITRPTYIASDVISIAAQRYHSIFLKSDGTVWVMGRNEFNQLGDGTDLDRDTPVKIASGVVKVFSGFHNTFFLKEDNSLWAAGENVGQYFVPDTSFNRSALPMKIAENVHKVVSSQIHTLILDNERKLWAWGDYTWYTEEAQPAQPYLLATEVSDVSVYYLTSMILKMDRTLWTVGYNSYGQLGDGTQEHRSSLKQVATDVIAIGTGTYQSFMVKSDLSFWATGWYKGSVTPPNPHFSTVFEKVQFAD